MSSAIMLFLAFIYIYVKSSLTIEVNVPRQNFRLQLICPIATLQKEWLQGKLWMCSVVGFLNVQQATLFLLANCIALAH